MFGRPALVRQNDQSDCGAAALATIALHYRKPIGLQQLRDLAGTDRIGANLLGLMTAAEKLGFAAKGVKGPFESLVDVPLPAIAHLKTEEGLGHFVVLHRARKNAVVVADPARGIQKQSREEFCKQWTGYLLIVEPDEVQTLKASVIVPTPPCRRLLRLLGFHKSVLAEGFLCALLMTLLGISTSYFVQHLVDSVLARREVELLNALGIGMVLIVLFRTLFGVLRQYLLAHVGRKVDLLLISAYTRHVLCLPTRFFEMRQVGEILSRVNDAAKVRQAISGTALTMLVDGVMVLFCVAVLWIYDIRLALVATAFVPLLMIAVAVHHPAIKRRSREAMEHTAELSAHLVEDISGVDTVKAFGLERLRAEEGESRLLQVVQSLFSLQKLGISMSSAGMFVTSVAGVAILWYGGHRVIEGALTVGQLLFFYTLLGFMLGPLERLSTVNLQIQDALVAINRLYEIMDLEAEQLDERRGVKLDRVREAIQLRDVSFQYGCRAKVLENITIQVPAGSTVAIVGESGSGKSTLLKLLMRFYDPTAGCILLDRVDFRDFRLASLRSRIGLVSQEPFVFNGTIRENIALGRPQASVDEIMEVTHAAGLEEYVSQLPDRYETVIGERGANLSGGQRQRLAIARALLRDPEILIFDEATSHLDAVTELAMRKNLQAALKGKTVVLVAHRLSTVKDADIIYVLHEGRIVEQGSHCQLLDQDGKYALLWRAQTDDETPPQLPRPALRIEADKVSIANGNGRLKPCATT